MGWRFETITAFGATRGALLKHSVCLCLILVTAAVYAPVRDYDFVDYDDCVYVTDEPRVRAGLTLDGVRWALTRVHANFYHPATTLSLMLDSTVWGPDNAGGYHLTNVLLHCANAALLFFVLRGMTGALWRSAVVAALFAWHPLRVESVAWVSQRKDVLSAFFWMLTMGAYLGYARRPGWTRYCWTLVCFGLGLMAKPILVTLPLALLLLDFWPLRRFDPAKGWRAFPRSLIWEKLPLLALALAAGGAEIAIHRNERLVLYPMFLRIENALSNYVSYIAKTLWPTNLSFYPFRTDISAWPTAGAVILLAAIAIATILAARRRPFLPVGWFWYVVTLGPVSGVMQVASHSMADRYTYVPTIGLLVAAVWGVHQAVERSKRGRIAVAFATTVALIALVGGTARQVRYWRDSAALWEHAVAVSPEDVTALNNLAWIRATSPDPGRRDGFEAVRLALRANEILLPTVKPEFVDTLAAALAECGRFDEAIRVGEAALREETSRHDSHLAPAIEARLQLYRRRLPFRE